MQSARQCPVCSATAAHESALSGIKLCPSRHTWFSCGNCQQLRVNQAQIDGQCTSCVLAGQRRGDPFAASLPPQATPTREKLAGPWQDNRTTALLEPRPTQHYGRSWGQDAQGGSANNPNPFMDRLAPVDTYNLHNRLL